VIPRDEQAAYSTEFLRQSSALTIMGCRTLINGALGLLIP
jgi:hypothetical protein